MDDFANLAGNRSEAIKRLGYLGWAAATLISWGIRIAPQQRWGLIRARILQEHRVRLLREEWAFAGDTPAEPTASRGNAEGKD